MRTLIENWRVHGGQAHEHTHGNKIEIFWQTRPSFSIRRERMYQINYKHTWKLNWYIFTFTEVFVNQKSNCIWAHSKDGTIFINNLENTEHFINKTKKLLLVHLPTPLAAQMLRVSLRRTCLYIARALSWCRFSRSLSLVGWCKVCSHIFPSAINE